MIDRGKIVDLQENTCKLADERAYEELYLLCFPSLTRFAYSFIKYREQPFNNREGRR